MHNGRLWSVDNYQVVANLMRYHTDWMGHDAYVETNYYQHRPAVLQVLVYLRRSSGEDKSG